MAFVSGYKHDVFISYAHVDNIPLSGTDVKTGWVTTFASNLNKLLSRKLSRDASIWMDHRELSGNAPLTPAIMNALRETATFIVIVSPRYLASEWCRREREGFLRLMNERSAAGTRVFMVEIDKVEKLPVEFTDLIGYRFWVQDWEDPIPRTLGLPVPDPRDQEYYNRLTRINYDLAEELKRLESASVQRPTDIPQITVAGASTKPAIFLAEVTDDLDSKREEVKDYLTQAGFGVLPETWRSYEDLAAFERAVDGEIKRCQIFAQLLSEVSGRKPFNQSYGYPRLQYERALQAGKTILQWRNEKLKVEDVADADHRLLLEGSTVRAEGIEEFKRALVEAASPPPPPATPPANGKFVFVSADMADRAKAKEFICQYLLERGISYAMLPTQTDPEAVRKFMEISLANCDAALVVYCATDQASVLGQVLQCRKVIAQREHPIPAIAIYDGPPSPEARDEISFRFPNLHLLNCRQDQIALEKFLDSLA
jgi:hypothetical protein